MVNRSAFPARAAALAALSLALPALAGCAMLTEALGPASAGGASCPAPSAADLVPESGALLGVSLDWTRSTIDDYADRLGRSPAVAVQFFGFPLTDEDIENLRSAADQLRPSGAALLVTLEPDDGLEAVTPSAAARVAEVLSEVNRSGVPALVRFAHEMNGSWYAWSQQPAAYVAAFRTVAYAVHREAPGSAMMWAPNYGGGYPFTGGRYAAVPGGADFAALDTDGDGALTMADDPYAPYYPGDDAVDWVGMSLYHWGSAYPWGENELPEDGKFAAQLTGAYAGLGGDNTALPDFYGTYAAGHGKPLAIPETAALVVPRGDAAGELAIKQAWWRQVFSADTAERFPQLHLIDWFEWHKTEPEVGEGVDWSVTTDPATRRAFAADLPSWALGADALPRNCATAP
ncbi:glycosyl hydrolase [Naasia sp. SYSU D00057]|uniref:glycoside hydrolase family 26 protein n=1 Tax=Naasia sp. SYSU D00057 TaxID=2817380 RepID=UPI0027DB70FB|nr:glycosyl hydrolase [Naasia sp. SYSU D00057]